MDNIGFKKFQERIKFDGDISQVLEQICKDYKLGSLVDFKVSLYGYEDFNISVKTSKGKYFIKIFAAFRDTSNCKRYVDIMTKVKEAGVAYPALYKSDQGNLYLKEFEGVSLKLCVQEYISGKNLEELAIPLSDKEATFLSEQAATINSMDFRPEHSPFDSWATVSLVKQFSIKKASLSREEIALVKPIVEEFKRVNLDGLPKCFVHGDIIRTNVLKDGSGKLWVLDFSVSNYQPRIVELSVLFHNLFNIPEDPEKTHKMRLLALKKYLNKVKLSTEEIKLIPLFTKATHAQFLMGATYHKMMGGEDTRENKYWLNFSKKALKMSPKTFSESRASGLLTTSSI